MDYRKATFYTDGIKYMLRSVFSGKELPLIGGIAINDKCNLHCRHCFVSNRHIPDLTFNEVKEGLQQLHDLRIRYLYIEGGEPFFWHDGENSLGDIVRLARKTGFGYIIIYTNGTFPIETQADAVFVSLDGLKETHDALRGKCFDRILENITFSSHKKIFINYTVTAKNQDEIIRFTREIMKTKNVKGISFYFYTPYHGRDELYLDDSDKRKALGDIVFLKKKGYPVLNSKTALERVVQNNWKRPNNLGYLFAENRMYRCCRAIDNDEICRECGYLGFSEIYQIAKFNPVALYTAYKYL